MLGMIFQSQGDFFQHNFLTRFSSRILNLGKKNVKMLEDTNYMFFFGFFSVNSSFGLAKPDVKMELGGPIPPNTTSPTFQSQGNFFSITF